MQKDNKKIVNPKTLHFEFGGPFGAFFITLSLPCVILGLYYLCTPTYCLQWSTLGDVQLAWAALLKDLPSLWSWHVFGVACGWMLFHVLLERFLPATIAKGVVLRTGDQLLYRVNAQSVFWVTVALALVLQFLQPLSFSLSWIYDHYVQLATSAIAIAALLSVYLYASSFAKNALLAEGGNSGNPIYDFYIGRELNPRIGDFDLKYFCELRPGLIAWTIINLGLLFKQVELAGQPSLSMLCVNVFQAIYVWDGLSSEAAILTTMDITTDGFGFMLAFGDLAWVPFTYTLQARYLVQNDPHLSPLVVVAIALLNLFGYYVFRSANSQKDQFRRDPASLPHLQTLATARGTKLLVSGWWGLARKINYTGDWLMGLSWCLVTGFDTILTYFYAIYFAVLLIHRAFRDDHACHLKYGNDWIAYKKRVPSLFIPKVF